MIVITIIAALIIITTKEKDYSPPLESDDDI
jgi:hypothetical protein